MTHSTNLICGVTLPLGVRGKRGGWEGSQWIKRRSRRGAGISVTLMIASCEFEEGVRRKPTN